MSAIPRAYRRKPLRSPLPAERSRSAYTEPRRRPGRPWCSTSTAAASSSAASTATTTSAPSFVDEPASNRLGRLPAGAGAPASRRFRRCAGGIRMGGRCLPESDPACRRLGRRQSRGGGQPGDARPSTRTDRPGADLSRAWCRRSQGSYVTHAEAPMLTVRDLAFYKDIRTGGADFSHDPRFHPLADTDFSACRPPSSSPPMRPAVFRRRGLSRPHPGGRR